MPFVHSTVRTNGDISICCQSNQATIEEQHKYNINSSSIDTFWQSEYLANTRKKLLAGEVLPECERCYKCEDQNITSLRQIRNAEYNIVQPKHAEKIIKYLGYDNLNTPIDFEIQITNLCNLKCIMCNEYESSTLLTENKLLKIAKSNQKDYEWNEDAIEHIKELFYTETTRHINIRGGEPFVVPQIKDILVTAINNGTAKKISLHITTNATRFDKDWIDILNEYKEVRLMCSIDAVDKLSEYIRFGSNWESIKSNISLMRQVKNANIVIIATLQNITMLGLSDLVKWTQSERLFLILTIVTVPAFFQIDVLPTELHKKAHDQLVVARNNLIDSALIPELDNIISRLENIESAYQTPRWDEFKQYVGMRESLRHNSIFTVIPELEEYWNEKP